MNFLRFLEPLSRNACRKTDVPPPRPSRDMNLVTQPFAQTRVENPRETSDASLRRREKYRAAVMLAGAVSAALTGTAWAGELTGDADRGAARYEACQDCSSLDKNHVEARHPSVFGREAPLPANYDYSDALKSTNIVWNQGRLDKWLTDPRAVAPGATMAFHLTNRQDRAVVIAYLSGRAK